MLSTLAALFSRTLIGIRQSKRHPGGLGGPGPSPVEPGAPPTLVTCGCGLAQSFHWSLHRLNAISVSRLSWRSEDRLPSLGQPCWHGCPALSTSSAQALQRHCEEQRHLCLQGNSVSSVTQSCLTLRNPMDCSMPGLPVHHQFPDFTQTHVHRAGDAIQPTHPQSSPSPSAFDLSQHQGLFK